MKCRSLRFCLNLIFDLPGGNHADQVLGFSGTQQVAFGGMSENSDDGTADFQCVVKINAGFHTHLFAHMQQILGGNVAGGSGNEGATPDSGKGAVKTGEARLHPGEDIGDSKAAGVVEIQSPSHLWEGTAHLFANGINMSGVGHAGGI